jgi:hypothetical protein
MEVNLPIEKTWNVIMDPNTIMLMSEEGQPDEIEYLECDSELQTGSCVSVKYKQIKATIVVNFTNVDPFKKCDTTAKGSFITMEDSMSFEEMGAEKTRIYNKVIIKSFLINFIDLPDLSNKFDLQYSKLNTYLNELADKEEMGCQACTK